MTEQTWLLEKIWACWFAGTMFLVSFNMSLSAFYGGLGVAVEDGVFVLRQGLARASINQNAGMILYLGSKAMLVAVPLAVILTVAVYHRSRSIKPAEVFESAGLGGMPYVTLVRLGVGSLCLPLILTMAKLLGLLP